eukprot:1603-Pyramimonas_sp.AAC.2
MELMLAAEAEALVSRNLGSTASTSHRSSRRHMPPRISPSSVRGRRRIRSGKWENSQREEVNSQREEANSQRK